MRIDVDTAGLTARRGGGVRARRTPPGRWRAVLWLGLTLLLAACLAEQAEDATDSAADGGEAIAGSEETAAGGSTEAGPSEEDEPTAGISAEPTEPVAEDVVDVLSRSADFTTLLAAIEDAGLVDTLRETDPVTIFAPTEDAFAATRTEVLEPILSDPEQLSELLLAHVVQDRWTQEQLRDDGDRTILDSLAGLPLRILRDADDIVTVNEEATITQPALEAGNGVVHAIDLVLVPPDLEPSEE